jgi:hypothetical protein
MVVHLRIFLLTAMGCDVSEDMIACCKAWKMSTVHDTRGRGGGGGPPFVSFILSNRISTRSYKFYTVHGRFAILLHCICTTAQNFLDGRVSMNSRDVKVTLL